MRTILIHMALYLFLVSAQAQQTTPKMQFNKNGELKIAQFTDMHLGKMEEGNQIVFEMIREVLDSEKPDIVIFTGDNTVSDDVEKFWQLLSREMATREIYWTAVLGNHDDEHAVKRSEIIRIIQKQPYCIMQEIAENIEGEGNHIIPVYASDKNKIEALLYCIDSNAYSTIQSVKGYGWMGLSQINWYREKSREYTQQNGGTPLPALGFFHIPLPEYTNAWESFETRRYGERNEKECSPQLNSGMFLSMKECGDIMGTFAGHDHINNYIATYYDIALAYGRASGGMNTYGDKTPGSRIIVLKEGKREFDTRIREKGNPVQINPCSYPESFRKEK